MQVLIADSQIVNALCEMADQASSSLIFLQYQFRVPFHPRGPMRRILASLLRAAERDVQIIILLNNPNRPKRPGPSHGAIRQYLAHQNIKILHHEGDQILHTKLCIADYSRILLGSHNLSQQSLSTSRNLSILTDDQEVTQRATTIALALIKRAHNGQP